MKQIAGLREVAEGYDGLILDLWGVVHDGVRPYPGAVDCLRALRAAGKRVVMLTNAPRRAEPIREQLRGMGVEDALYDGVMSSGEAVHLMLRDRPDAWWAGLGRRVYHLGPERDRNVVAGLDLELVGRPGAATVLLNTGPDDQLGGEDEAAFDPVLKACAAAGLPMICANPDLAVIRGGVRVICAGALAVRYEAMGGQVASLGKPDPAIYAPVFGMLGVERGRVLAVGDALRTDIAGAAAVGVDACWVLGGLHGAHGAGWDVVEAEARGAGLAPAAAVGSFIW